MLYGGSPFTNRTAQEIGLLPVMTLRAKIIAINNVEAGGGTMGTNIAYMYDNLANQWQYKKVEGESPLDNEHYEEDFDEYKAKHGKNQVLKQRFGLEQHHVGPRGLKKFAQGSV